MNDRDDGYTADNESEIYFPDRQTKEKFLSDVSSAKEDKNVLNTVKEKYKSTKSMIKGAIHRYEENQKKITFNQVDDMRDNLPNVENNKNGSKKK